MKLKYKLATLAAASVLNANATTVIVDTTPANNQANLTKAAGQTFTTATLGTDNLLSSVDVMGPQGGATATVYTAEIWTDTDGNFATWDPGVLVAASTNSIAIDTDNTLHTFDFSNPSLSDSTVYVVSFNDGGTNHAGFRSGLTNEAADTIADGALFSAGIQPFGGAFDMSMQITTTGIPEPSSITLLGLAGLGILRRRRK